MNKNLLFAIPLLLCLMPGVPVRAETVVLAVPGPGSVTYLPVYLARAIAADRAEGLELRLRYFPGGPLALRDLRDNNSDFAATGLPAITSARAEGMPLFAIGQFSQSAMYTLLLRTELKAQVRDIAQLAGRRIGTTASTRSARSMGHMMIEYLLRQAGVQPGSVQFLSAGQDRDAQRAALASGTVDALLGDEPFASEMVAQGAAVRLADLYAPQQSNALLGGPIVHAALATRENVYAEHPETVKKVLRMFDRTLQWMASHSAQEIVERLSTQPGFDPAMSDTLAAVLERNHGMFTSRVAWNPAAADITERFFHDMAASAAESRLPFAAFLRGPPQ